MDPYEIGGLIITLLLFIGCIIYCCRFARQWRPVESTIQRHGPIGRKSAWDAEEDEDDPWKLNIKEEEESVAKPTIIKAKREPEIFGDFAGSTVSSQSRSHAEADNAGVSNDWIINFNNE